MKIVITENRRNEAITKWLNQEYGDLKRFNPNNRYIHYIDNYDNTIFVYNDRTGLVTIEDEYLQRDLSSMFGLDGYELNNILIPWLEERYNLQVPLVKFQETTWHCNECGRYHTTRYHIDD